ncbi:MAG: ABC transporter substrate-binding protein [Rubrivivax sp.]|nr:ABC transporter substrate-binding protein [Rubrivivax sp.]
MKLTRTLRRWLLPSALALAATQPAFAQEQGVTDNEILIGEVLMLTSPGAFIGKTAQAGSKLAVAEINAAGGINGRKLRVLYEDDGYVPARSVSAMRKLLDVDKVFAITGTTGGSGVTAIMPVIEEKGAPTIVHLAPNPTVLTPRRPSVFMVGPDYDVAAYEGVRYLVEKQGKRGARFGLLFQNDDYGKSVQRGYLRAITELKLNNVVEVPYQRGAKDFSAEALRMKSAGVEVLVLATTISEPAGILSETRRLNMDLTVVGNWSSGLPVTIKLAQQYGYDYYFNDYYASLSEPAGQRLMQSARKHLAEDEVAAMSRYSVSSYLGIKVMAEAIARCGRAVTKACVIGQLAKLKDFDTGGLSGPISLDNPQGHASPPLKMYQVNTRDGSVKALTEFGAR